MQRVICLFLMAWLCIASQAVAEKRVALLIGNGSYTAVRPLPNSRQDARLMAETLAGLGFDVTLVDDGSFTEMRTAIGAFGAKLREGGADTTGLFYYSGHGVQSFRRNYLLPVDAALTDAADLSLVGIEAESVLRQMRSAGNKINIVILDACRNNPFKDLLDMGENGLAEMSAPTGTFLAYSTEPGATALDGPKGTNSPFTAALAREIKRPGQPLEQVFKEVRRSVLKETFNTQTPWDTSSLTADFYFVPVVALTPEQEAEKQLWGALSASNDPVQVMLFLKAYPDSSHAADARQLLKKYLDDTVSVDPETALPEVTTIPGDDEQAAFDLAQSTATRAAYEAFVAQYPDSIFVEAANLEIAALPNAPVKQAALAAPADGADNGAEKGLKIAAGNVSDVEDPALYEDLTVTFDTPLVVGTPEMIGRSLEELITQGAPIYPPFDGLPEEAWKDQKCTTCHQWNRAILCDQAKVLLGGSGETAERSMAIKHPLGRSFKLTLRAWAKGDCL